MLVRVHFPYFLGSFTCINYDTIFAQCLIHSYSLHLAWPFVSHPSVECRLHFCTLRHHRQFNNSYGSSSFFSTYDQARKLKVNTCSSSSKPRPSYGMSLAVIMGSHSVTCYPTQVNAIRLNPRPFRSDKIFKYSMSMNY